MERRDFLKLTLGFVAGAAAFVATAHAAPLPPISPDPGRVPPGNPAAEPAITTQDDVDRLEPAEVRGGHGGGRGRGHGRGWGRHRGWGRRRWGWRRRHWGWR